MLLSMFFGYFIGSSYYPHASILEDNYVLIALCHTMSTIPRIFGSLRASERARKAFVCWSFGDFLSSDGGQSFLSSTHLRISTANRFLGHFSPHIALSMAFLTAVVNLCCLFSLSGTFLRKNRWSSG